MSGIERAREQDGPQILRLTDRVAVFSPEEVSCVNELWREYLAKGDASGYVFLVCKDGDSVEGYACFGPHSLTHGTFDLYWIAVDPMTQRHGIGRTLLAQVEAEVQRLGGRLILIETSGTPPYAPARRFYEMRGYHYQAVVHDFYAPGDDLIIFAKHLNHNAADVPLVMPFPRALTNGKTRLDPTPVAG